jgi:Gpi18-like mannosyltransferase
MWPLCAIVVAGFLLRAAVLPAPGFAGDMHQIVGWAMLAKQYGAGGLYTHVYPGTGRHLDYPSFYALILLATVHAYEALRLSDPEHRFLTIALKLPATLADLGLCVATFLFARRWFSMGRALVAASIAAVTPSTWLISAWWGQVDSLAAVFVAFALYAAIAKRYVVAWTCLTLGVLVKPLPIVIAPLLVIWQARSEGLSPRLALGPAASLVTAYLVSLPFAPPSPPATFAWLARFVQAGIARYPLTSFGAFNLYTVTDWLKGSDEVRILGISLRLWGQIAFGILLAATACALAIRLGGERDRGERERALVTACFLVLAGMFVLLTRMHERYLFFAAALAPALWYAGPWQRVVGATVMATFTINCATIFYSYAAGSGSPSHAAAPPHADTSPHYGLLVQHVVSLVNVVALAALAYYVGSNAPRRSAPSPLIVDA